MFYRNLFSIISLFILISAGNARSQGVAGKWEGTVEISSKKKSGEKQTFQFEFQLEEFGETIKGTSRISTVIKPGEPYRYALMEVSGTFIDNVFAFKEVKVISQEGFKDPLEWCLKTGSLDFILLQEKPQLVGRWEGKNGSGPCAPGTINVVKIQ